MIFLSLRGDDLAVKKYRISQFAKKLCVSLDFIRFYEGKGLIESIVDHNNGYHYYDISQSEIVYLIQQYRKLGYSVNEIVDILQHSTVEQLLQKHTALAASHKDMIKFSSQAIRYLDELSQALSSPNGTWYIVRMPAIWYLPHAEGDDFLDSSALQEEYRFWVENAPLLYSLDKWTIRPDGTLASIRHGRAIDCSVAEDFGFKPGASAELYGPKRCLEYYMDSTDFITTSPGLENIRSALDILLQKNFTLDGDIFLRHIALYSENGNLHNRFVVYIPIK